MGKLRRNVVSVSAASALLAGSSAIALPGTAVAAEPLVAGDCGTTVSGEPGQPVSLDLESALGLPDAPTISLGAAESGTNTISVPGSRLLESLSDLPLLGSIIEAAVPSVCQVTVEAVNTAAEPVQEATEPVREQVRDTTERVQENLPGGSDPEPADPPQSPEPPQEDGGSAPDSQNTDNSEVQQSPVPDTPDNRSSNSDVYRPDTAPGSAGPPGYFAAGSLPMENFSSAAPNAGGTAPAAPGLRYGNQQPGYAPEFGLLGQDELAAKDRDVASAGSADALPSHGRDTIELSTLLAVLAVSAASAGLVRAWVLRRAFSST